jgi:hypothetical protein
VCIEARKRLRGCTPNAFIGATVLLLCLLVLTYGVHRQFDHDEFEHIHAAWYVAKGYTPYIDFFQNHHPLIWYCLAPLLLLLGYSTQTLVVLRLATFGLTMGIGFATFLIARRATSSTTAGLLSVLILLSVVMFLEKGVEIRPDVPQVLLGLASVYLLLRYLRSGRNRDVILAGLAASFSFLFLQKTVFLLIAYGIALCAGLLKSRTWFRSSLLFAVSFSLPVLLFLGCLRLWGATDEYLLSNWLVHASHLRPFSPLTNIYVSFATQNALFWILIPISVGYVLLNRKTSDDLRTAAYLGTALLLSVWLLKRPHRQNFLFSIPLLCIPLAYLLEKVAAKFRRRGIVLGVLVVLILIQPTMSFAPELLASRERHLQLEKVDYVYANTTASDVVYDGAVRFNLFRRDLHYFWLPVGDKYPAEALKRLGEERHGDYNLCRLLKSKRPRFISDYRLDRTACGLGSLYDETPYKDLYMLRDLEGVKYPLWRDVGGVAALVGYGVQWVSADTGYSTKVTLHWLALARADVDYTVFVHLMGPGDTILAQMDTLLQLDERTTSKWKVRQQGTAQYLLATPSDLPAEPYSVVVGLYHWQTGERLPVWDESGERLADDTIVLDRVTLTD